MHFLPSQNVHALGSALPWLSSKSKVGHISDTVVQLRCAGSQLLGKRRATLVSTVLSQNVRRQGAIEAEDPGLPNASLHIQFAPAVLEHSELFMRKDNPACSYQPALRPRFSIVFLPGSCQSKSRAVNCRNPMRSSQEFSVGRVVTVSIHCRMLQL